MKAILQPVRMLVAAATMTAGQAGASGLEISAVEASELFETEGPRREAIMPISLIWEEGGWRARMTMPYDLFRDDDDRVTRTLAGGQDKPRRQLRPMVGNTTVTLSRALDLGGSIILDLAGEVKMPTAQTERWNGTGRLNSLVEANLSGEAGHWSYWMTGTRHFQTRTRLIPLHDNWDARIGLAYAIGRATEVSLEGNYWQSPWQGESDSRDLTLTLSRDAGSHNRFEAYATYGFTGYFSGVTAALSWKTTFRRRHP